MQRLDWVALATVIASGLVIAVVAASKSDAQISTQNAITLGDQGTVSCQNYWPGAMSGVPCAGQPPLVLSDPPCPKADDPSGFEVAENKGKACAHWIVPSHYHLVKEPDPLQGSVCDPSVPAPVGYACHDDRFPLGGGFINGTDRSEVFIGEAATLQGDGLFHYPRAKLPKGVNWH